jgi:hypothetical protein
LSAGFLALCLNFLIAVFASLLKAAPVSVKVVVARFKQPSVNLF